MMAPEGANCDKEVTSSSSGNWRQYLNFSSEKEGDCAPEPSTARTPAFREAAHEPSTSSTWSGSWIEKWLNQEEEVAESGHTNPKDPSEQAGPSKIAPPGPSSTGLGPAELLRLQSEMKNELLNFLQSHTLIKPKFNFVNQVEEDLQIEHSDLPRLSKMKEVMDTLKECEGIKSGSEAAKQLKASMKEWEKNGRP